MRRSTGRIQSKVKLDLPDMDLSRAVDSSDNMDRVRLEAEDEVVVVG